MGRLWSPLFNGEYVMAKIVRNLPGLIPMINGVTFELIAGDDTGRSVSTHEVDEEMAARFLAVPGFSVMQAVEVLAAPRRGRPPRIRQSEDDSTLSSSDAMMASDVVSANE